VTRESWLEPPPYSPTIPQLLRHTVPLHPKGPFVIGASSTLTFENADRQSGLLAKALLERGAGKATRIGILMGNSPEWVVAYLAITRIGAIAVLLSTLYQRRDLEWVLRHADVHTLLMSSHYLSHDYVARLEEVAPDLMGQSSHSGLATQALPYLRHVVIWGDTPDWAQSAESALRAADEFDDGLLAAIEDCVAPADLAVLMYTSGSTADPKGILHTHGAIVRRMNILSHVRGLSPIDRTLVVGPLCWAAGFIAVNMALLSRSSIICPASPKMDDIVAAMERDRPTELSAQPGMIKQIREHPRVVAGKIDQELLDRRLNSPRSDQATRGLGMTESFGQHSVETRTDHVPPEKIEAFGRGVPDMERRLKDPETSTCIGPVGQGILWLRSQNLMQGFYKRERHEVFDADGFYSTGDLCRIDEDGYLFFIGRRTEMIKVSGANVAPREVELALEAYAEIQEACVFELERNGQAPFIAAVVIAKPGAKANGEDLRARLRRDISSFKVPKAIYEMSDEEAPRTGSGKLHKQRLREKLAATTGSV
jgi:acyl-CoA synthetase (AMP-forming)/AMP-acid ligase II